VGYTNAGKSTLFNRITVSEVYAADQLFATLDPTLRRIELNSFGPIVLADTVGFIRHLPHKLVDAFRATLEETVEADLLLHIVDASSPERDTHIAAVDEVLGEVGATAPILIVYNKLDRLEGREPRIDRDDLGQPVAVWLSAKEGIGLDLLQQAMAERLGPHRFEGWIALAPVFGRLRAKLFDRGAVVKEAIDEKGLMHLYLRLPDSDLHRFLQQEGLVLADILSSHTSPLGEPSP
jgi:GTP-binding protein HflX